MKTTKTNGAAKAAKTIIPNGATKVTLPRNDPLVKRLLGVATSAGRSPQHIVNSILQEEIPKMENAKTIPSKATWRAIMMREISYPEEVRLQDTPIVMNMRVLERIVARASGMTLQQAHFAMSSAVDVVIAKAGKASTVALAK